VCGATSVDLTVRAYDKFVKATGISAPVAASTAGVSKGQGVRATGIAAAVDAAVASTDKGAAVSGQTAVAGVNAPIAGVDKGTGVSANGQSAPVNASQGAVQKGEAVGAGGMIAPVSMGDASVNHLKPDHRWDFSDRVEVPNLITDPEIFNPSTTSWDDRKDTTFLEVAENVGPNGEDAYEWSFDSIDGYFQTNGSFGIPPYSLGFFVRAVSGTIDLQTRSWDNDAIHGPIVTVDTGWQWVKDLKITSSITHVGVRGKETGNIYVLRAGLNRGTQLGYSTKTDEPQTFVDVIGGADLQNGSTSGADTNDLKLRAPGGVVSDGDDFTADVDSAVAGEGTWGLGVYLPAQSNLSGVQKIFGNRADGIELAWDEGAQQFVATIQDSGGTNRQATVAPSSPYSVWHDVMLTVSGSDLRLNVGGTVTTIDLSGFTPLTDPHPLVNAEASGMVVRTPEKHPVLTEAEAEAVRKRLATAPEDPVPPTERWDLSTLVNPHNFFVKSENFGDKGYKSGVTWNRDVVTDPNGDTTADKLKEDTSTNTSHYQKLTGGKVLLTEFLEGEKISLTVYAKQAGRNWLKVNIRNEGAFESNSQNISVYFNISNGQIGTVNDPNNKFNDYKIKDVGSGWKRLAVNVTTTDVGKVTGDLALKDGDGAGKYDGDGSSGIYFWGGQLTRGKKLFPKYVKTGSSIAFPQTAPAQRASENDLTLGSTSNSDTNDPDWVAPNGLINDGDDKLLLPDQFGLNRRATFVWGFQANGSRYSFGSGGIGNGWVWKIRLQDNHSFLFRDKNGDIRDLNAGNLGGKDGSLHAVSVTIDDTQKRGWFEMDGGTGGPYEVDYSDLGELKDSPLNALGSQADYLLEHIEVYTRVLSDEEALHARQRILESSDSRIPLLK